MKKILLIVLAVLLSIPLLGKSRERAENPAIVDARITNAILDYLRDEGYTVLPEVIVQDTLNRKKSDYEKYWEEKHGMQLDKPMVKHEPKPEFDDLYFQPSKDGKRMKHQKNDTIKKDTIRKNSIIKDPITINNYYYDDNDFYYANRINRFHRDFWFDFYYSPFYYSPYYSWYSPYYYDSWYWGYNSWYGWNFSFGWHSPYYGWYSPYYWHNWYAPRYYIHNDYNYYGHNNVQYGRRERPSTLTQPSRRPVVAQNQTQTRSITTTQERRVATNPQDKPVYNQNRRTYSPTYETPRMGTRPNYNNTRTNSYTRQSTTTERSTTIRSNNSTNVDRPIYSRPSTSGTNSRPAYSTPNNNRSSSYSTPSRSSSTPNRSTYSAPSRSSSSYNNSSFGGSRSSGSSFSGGGSTGGSRSSGGSSSSSSSSHSSGGRR